MKEIPLLPQPRQLSRQQGHLSIVPEQFILIDAPQAAKLIFSARLVQQAVQNFAHQNWAIAAGTFLPKEKVGATLCLTPGATSHPQGYKLTITQSGIHAVASTPAGLFYAANTLKQLLQGYGSSLPNLRIEDWPDFPNRGVMLDVSRNRVLKMETLFPLVDMLASWKINQLQLYTEHTFAYQHHPVVWANASPYTAADILELDAYCQERFIELVPNQNSMGHMHNWLKHEPYHHLAEALDGAMTPWGFVRPGPFGLAPTEPDTLPFVRGLYDELLPNFSSNQFNIGGDEAYDIGQGKSKALVEELGNGRVYLNFLLELYGEVKRRGRTMQFWGDIIVNYPDLVAELPRDAIALEWGYEDDHPFDQNSELFANSGIPFYVCPGTSSWNSLAGRTNNTIENMRNAAENGAKHGAIGYLITDWGDRGHWQPLVASHLGYAYGAALAWDQATNRDCDIADLLDRYVFGDTSGIMGRLLYDLGNAYEETGVSIHNMSLLFALCQIEPADFGKIEGQFKSGKLSANRLRQSISFVDKIESRLDQTKLNIDESNLLKREMRWAAQMIRHGGKRGLWLLAESDYSVKDLAAEADSLIKEFSNIWQIRNRPGGIDDALKRLEKMRAPYLESTE